MILLSEDLVGNLEEIVIDEEKLSALTGIVKTKKGTELKTSDHNSIVCRLNGNGTSNLRSIESSTLTLRTQLV